MKPSKNMAPDHFQWELKNGLGIITIIRPERKNPLTFDSYAELRDTFRDFSYTAEIRAVIINGAGGNFCSGGDVHEIIGPLTKMNMKELLAFTRMTGDLVKAIRQRLGGEITSEPIDLHLELVGEWKCPRVKRSRNGVHHIVRAP